MLQKQIDKLTLDDITSLIDNAIPESTTLDYKEMISLDKDEDKREFLYDATSFANTSGGDIIFGIREKRNLEGRTTGLPSEAIGIDDAQIDSLVRKMESLLQNSIDPRISHIKFQRIAGFSNGSVLVMRIPQSFNAPHMVAYEKVTRFYSRNNAGKYQLDVHQLKEAFILSESLTTRIQQFLHNRLSKIAAGETPLPLLQGPTIALHIIPFSAFSLRSKLLVDLTDINLITIAGYVNRFRRNLDGWVRGAMYEYPLCTGYTQMFKNGIIEAVDAHFLKQREKSKTIPIRSIEEGIIKTLRSSLEFINKQDITPPIVISLNLMGVKGRFIPTENTGLGEETTFDRDHLAIPEILIENTQEPADIILRPIFDSLWQASGYQHDHYYNQQSGRWV